MSVLSQPQFHDEAAAFAYVEAELWPNGPICPHCGGFERISALTAQVSAVTARPTDQQVGVFRQFAPVLQKNLVAYKRVRAVELPKINDKLQKLGKPPIQPQAKEIRPPRTVASIRQAR